MKLRGFSLAVLTLAWPALPLAHAADRAALHPGKLEYALRLVNSPSGEIVDFRGRLSIETRITCDSVFEVSRLRIEGRLRTGSPVDIANDRTSTESLDRRRMTFSVSTHEGLSLDLRGSAKIPRPGGPGIVFFDLPLPGRLKLPKGTVLPLAYADRLVRAFSNGLMRLSQIVYFGASHRGPSLIVDEEAPGPVPRRINELHPDFAKMKAWRIETVSFDGADKTSLPVSTSEAVLYESGESDVLSFNVGPIKLETDVISVERYDPPKCYS